MSFWVILTPLRNLGQPKPSHQVIERVFRRLTRHRREKVVSLLKQARDNLTLTLI
jgi:hypothetical protein